MLPTHQQLRGFLHSIYRVDNYGDLTDSNLRRVKQTEDEVERKHYPYIAYDDRCFVRVLDGLTKICAPKTFIDVGCGIGDKLALAYKFFGLTAYGIEYNAENVKRAKRFLSKRKYLERNTTIYQGDAFEHDFAPYDLTYMYHPIRDPQRQAQLFRHVLDTMSAGSVVVEVLGGYFGSLMHEKVLPRTQQHVGFHAFRKLGKNEFEEVTGYEEGFHAYQRLDA